MGASEEKGNGSEEWRVKGNKTKKEALRGPEKIVCYGLRSIINFIWAPNVLKK